MTGANIGVYGLDRSVTDIVKGTRSRTLEVSSKGEIRTECSDSELEEKWNDRVKEMKLPPWIPMVEPSSDKETQVEGSRLGEDATSTLEECLKCFFQDKCRNTRHLIAPQSIYGWDQAVLLQELEPLIHEANEANEGSGAERISYLKIELQLPPPMLHLHQSQGISMSPLTIMGRLSPAIENYLMLIGSLLCIFLSFSREQHENLGMFSISLLVASYFLFFLRHHPSVHNSIGLAWSMKDWVETDFSNEMSEDDVKEKLVLESDRMPQVKLSNGKWYKRAGTEEKEWVDRNKERIRVAIKDRTVGEVENEKDVKF